jgi:hypothetical protein
MPKLLIKNEVFRPHSVDTSPPDTCIDKSLVDTLLGLRLLSRGSWLLSGGRRCVLLRSLGLTSSGGLGLRGGPEGLSLC